MIFRIHTGRVTLHSLSTLLWMSLIVVSKANTKSFTPFRISSKVFRRNWPYGNAGWKRIAVSTSKLQRRYTEVGRIIQKNKVNALGLWLWNLRTFLVLKREILMSMFSSFFRGNWCHTNKPTFYRFSERFNGERRAVWLITYWFKFKICSFPKYTEIREYVVLMSSVSFDCTHRCGQMFSFMKNMKSGSRNMSVEILKAWMWILTREIQRDVGGLSKQKMCQVCHHWLICFKTSTV